MTCLKSFLISEAGAVTVDWVVLAAAITGLGMASVAAVRSGTSALADDVETSLTSASVTSLGCMGSNTAASGFGCYTGPTIAESLGGFGYAMGGGCWMNSDGTGGCNPSTMVMVEQYRMSDGQVYTRYSTSSGGTTTITWTNDDGDPVEAPPPMG